MKIGGWGAEKKKDSNNPAERARAKGKLSELIQRGGPGVLPDGEKGERGQREHRCPWCVDKVADQTAVST